MLPSGWPPPRHLFQGLDAILPHVDLHRGRESSSDATTTSFSTLTVLVRGSFVLGGGDLLKEQPGHSIGPRKLWDAGTFKYVARSYCFL